MFTLYPRTVTRKRELTMQLKIIFYVICVSQVWCAPKSRNRQQVSYDQKQTGDYNIQLHLKDFQIVALLGEDTIGSFGDYEYNYDYSDFTVKPHNQTTPAKPQQPSSTFAPTSNQSFSSPKPATTTPVVVSDAPQPTSTTLSTSRKPSANPLLTSRTTLSPTSTEEATSTLSGHEKKTKIETAPTSTENNLLSSEAPIDAIKLGEFVETTSGKLKVHPVTSVTIVPSFQVSESTVEADEEEQNDVPTLSEILHYRRCANGYSRDKRGRCRKIRRPGVLPFGITRLASNLAAKFRQSASDGTSITSKSAKN